MQLIPANKVDTAAHQSIVWIMEPCTRTHTQPPPPTHTHTPTHTLSHLNMMRRSGSHMRSRMVPYCGLASNTGSRLRSTSSTACRNSPWLGSRRDTLLSTSWGQQQGEMVGVRGGRQVREWNNCERVMGALVGKGTEGCGVEGERIALWIRCNAGP